MCSPSKPPQISATAAAPKAARIQQEGIFAKVKRVTSQPSLAITAASQAAANAVARVSEAASSGAMRRQSSGSSDARCVSRMFNQPRLAVVDDSYMPLVQSKLLKRVSPGAGQNA